MTDEIPSELPPHVLEFMPVTQEEWRGMDQQERQVMMEETVERFVAAMQPLLEFFQEELVPWTNETAQAIAEPLVDVAMQIDQAGVDHSQMSVQESMQINKTVEQAKKLRRMRDD